MLSRDWRTNKPDAAYDFVIVGSGYGGAITAARIANAGLNPKPKICILERGMEWKIGDFPDTLDGYLSESRSNTPPLLRSNPLGLYELLNYEQISVIKGNGLGGTSLVNANVAIVPDEDVFELDSWPSGVTRDVLMPFYGKARETLDVSPHPRFDELLKVKSLSKRAAEIGVDVTKLDIAVNFKPDGPNQHGVEQRKCIDCGDCVSGCNVGAKNTLYMNYLPIAHAANAKGTATVHIYTQMKVQWVKKLAGGGWQVHGVRVDRTLNLPGTLFDVYNETEFDIQAKNVVLSAGAINSTEILLRSADKQGLSLSPMVGSRFGGNGDFFGFAYNGDVRLETLGFGAKMANPNPGKGPGPTITAAIRYNAGKPLTQRFTIEDLSFPKMFVGAAQRTFAALRAEDTDSGDEAMEEARKNLDRFGLNRYDPNGALNHTMLYLCMGFDDARGHFVYDAPFTERDGRVRVVWPGAGTQPVFGLLNEEIRRLARSVGGAFLENPLFGFANIRHLFTAHPLGGCPMGDDHVSGAVDQFGRVFAGDGSIHGGLFVIDGATLPSALGVNPFMTISAVAERAAHFKILELGGTAYPARAASVGFAGIDPIGVINRGEQELDRIFEAAPTLGIDVMVNHGGSSIDRVNRQIINDRYWKGFFPKGHVLNLMSAAIFTGFRKEFWKEADGSFAGKTSDTDRHILADNTLTELTLDSQQGDLRPGRYIRLNYTNPEWSGFYDIFKVINKDLLIGRVYMGKYPNGLRQFTFPMTRRYDYQQMTVLDHEELWKSGEAPAKEELQGTWRMDTISNANQAAGVAFLSFDNKPDGRLEARYQLMGLLEGLILPRFLQDHFELRDFTPFHDEIRKLDDDLMIGRWITDLPLADGLNLPANSFGIFHLREDPATGQRQFGFYYLLHNTSRAGLPTSRLLDPVLNASLPRGVGLEFDETMEGWYFPDQHVTAGGRAGDLEIRDRIPPGGATPCSFTVTMTVRDMNDFIEGSEHEANLSGTIRFGIFEGHSNAEFAVVPSKSRFNYLRVNPSTGEAEMRYFITFEANGRTFTFEGLKYMQKDESGPVRTTREVLDDYTTLYTHVYEDKLTGRVERGTGLVKFRTFEDLHAFGNLAGFLGSFRATGHSDPGVRLLALLKFYPFTGRFVQLEYDPLAPEIGVAAGQGQ
jgi:cholesterol oxidase